MRDDARFCTIPCVTLPFPPPVPGVPPVRKRAVWLRRIGPARDVLILLVILGLGAALSPTTPRGGNTFLQPGNLTDALRAVAPVGIAALAMTLVILTGGIDLSVGSAAALAGVVAGRLLVEWHPGWPLGIHVASAMGLALLGCGAAGMLNGAVIAALRIQPFVITLASMIGVRGLALWLANNERIGLGVGQDAPGTFGAWLSGKAAMIGIWAVLALVAVVVLERTVFGRYVRALGDNPEAARQAGLPVRWIQFAVYTISGALAGLAGLLIAARTTTGDPNAGVAMELDTIAVVVIGGASLSGGKGGIVGTVIGTMIIGAVTNVLGLRNVDFNMQLVLKAVIIVLAVASQRRRLQRRG